VYPERMLVRTVSGSGFIKHRSKMIPLTIALSGYPVAIDPHLMKSGLRKGELAGYTWTTRGRPSKSSRPPLLDLRS